MREPDAIVCTPAEYVEFRDEMVEFEKREALGAIDRRIAACQQRRRAAIMRASRAVSSDEGALTRC